MTAESCKAVRNRRIQAVSYLHSQHLRSKNHWTMVHNWSRLLRLAVHLAAVKQLRYLQFYLQRMPKKLRMKRVRWLNHLIRSKRTKTTSGRGNIFIVIVIIIVIFVSALSA